MTTVGSDLNKTGSIEETKTQSTVEGELPSRRRFFTKATSLLALPAVASVVGCESKYESKGMFLDGAVIVEYQQSSNKGTNDYLTFRFYEEGEYKIRFSITPDKNTRGSEYLPKDFTRSVKNAPAEFLIEQYRLPDFLRVTISRDDKQQSKDFS